MGKKAKKWETTVATDALPLSSAQACEKFWRMLEACGTETDALRAAEDKYAALVTDAGNSYNYPIEESVQTSSWDMFRQIVYRKNLAALKEDFVVERALEPLEQSAVISLTNAQRKQMGK